MMKRLYFYILISLTTIFVACDDDDTFSTSPSNRLTFSVDTLSLDTVFSTIPTSTHTLWVRNKSGDGLRIAQVRLERGNQTGFRVNVDGEYLDNDMGSLINNLEIRKSDSVRVFVELTSALTGEDIPQLVEDNLVFLLESGVEQKINLRAYSWDALLFDSLIINSDTVISSVKPMVIRKGIKIDSMATLNINAPTKLFFRSGAGIDVYGRIVVNGVAGNDVVLRGDRLDNMFDYLPYDRVIGQWKGIRIHPSSTNNVFNYADIHSSEYGIVCDSAAFDINALRLELNHVTIHNCKGAGLKTYNTHLLVANSQITNTLADCMAVYGGRAMVVYSTLGQFYPFDANRGVALRFTNYHEDYAYPLHGIECYNTLVTGYADDVIMGDSKDSTVVFAYYFENCILRTPQPDSTSVSMKAFVNTIFELPEQEGKYHFKTIDIDNQYYDFHLDSISEARKKAVPLLHYTDDRDGIVRPDSADIGCYQYR